MKGLPQPTHVTTASLAQQFGNSASLSPLSLPVVVFAVLALLGPPLLRSFHTSHTTRDLASGQFIFVFIVSSSLLVCGLVPLSRPFLPPIEQSPSASQSPTHSLPSFMRAPRGPYGEVYVA